jgi:hypothetical protein
MPAVCGMTRVSNRCRCGAPIGGPSRGEGGDDGGGGGGEGDRVAWQEGDPSGVSTLPSLGGIDECD